MNNGRGETETKAVPKESNFPKYNDGFIEGCGRNAQEWGREGDRSGTMLPAPPRPVDRNS